MAALKVDGCEPPTRKVAQVSEQVRLKVSGSGFRVSGLEFRV